MNLPRKLTITIKCITTYLTLFIKEKIHDVAQRIVVVAPILDDPSFHIMVLRKDSTPLTTIKIICRNNIRKIITAVEKQLTDCYTLITRETLTVRKPSLCPSRYEYPTS